MTVDVGFTTKDTKSTKDLGSYILEDSVQFALIRDLRLFVVDYSLA